MKQTKVTVKKLVPWSIALNAARTTSRKDDVEKEPSDGFKRQLLRAEHSPIRAVTFEITMHDIPYYVSVHLSRHKFGVEHFVTTQRDDRTENIVSRNDLPQGTLVTHKMIINAQALISISRKRLCRKADPATRHVWEDVMMAVEDVDIETGLAMVPECIYRGFCPEKNSCRFIDGNEEILEEYRLF